MKTFNKKLELAIAEFLAEYMTAGRMSQAIINKAIVKFKGSMQDATLAFQERILKEAINIALKQKLTKQEAIAVSHIKNIIVSRFDKKHNIIHKLLDIDKAWYDFPLNISKELSDYVKADYLADDNSMGLNQALNGMKGKYKNRAKILRNTKLDQTKLDAKMKTYPDDVPMMYIAQHEEDKRSEVCHSLHGTVWENKSMIPNWSRPLIHPNCKCKIVPIANTVDKVFTVQGKMVGRKCTKPKWLESRRGLSNVKKVKGKCEWTYRTLVEKV